MITKPEHVDLTKIELNERLLALQIKIVVAVVLETVLTISTMKLKVHKK